MPVFVIYVKQKKKDYIENSQRSFNIDSTIIYILVCINYMIMMTEPITQEQAKDTKSKKSKYLLKRVSESVQSEALKVINERIEHYKATGNKRKLSIYEAKKKAQGSLLNKLKSMVKKDG